MTTYQALITERHEMEWERPGFYRRPGDPTPTPAEIEAWQREVHDIRRRNCARAVACSFPRRAVEAAIAADESAPAIAQMRAWVATDGICVLAGPTGVGKTVGATWWAMRQQHSKGSYIAAPLFVTADAFFRAARWSEDRERWRSAPTLIVDDLGLEPQSDAVTADFDVLVDRFYAERGRLVLTTNLTAAQFRERYGARAHDRLREAGEWLSIVGPSLRRRSA